MDTMESRSPGEDVIHSSSSSSSSSSVNKYLPPIPVVMRHPYVVASVKQFRSESQNEQLQQHIVSESFIPMAPNLTKPPRKRRRPPFSYSSLIAQAILESENERMTLRDIYSWITNKYPALYSAEDMGWQNTIRHNLSLNRCFRKVAKSELEGTPNHRGKGGYWTIDPSHMVKFKNGAFARGSTTLMRRKPHGHETPILPNTPVPSSTTNSSCFSLSAIDNNNKNNNNNSNNNDNDKDDNMDSITTATTTTTTTSTSNTSNTIDFPSSPPLRPTTPSHLPEQKQPSIEKQPEPCHAMQIHNLLN